MAGSEWQHRAGVTHRCFRTHKSRVGGLDGPATDDARSLAATDDTPSLAAIAVSGSGDEIRIGEPARRRYRRHGAAAARRLWA